MKRILARANRAVLARFLQRDTLIAFDYDGTLAPIVANPARTRMRRATRDLLARIAHRNPTIVVTGRALDDAAQLMHGIGLREIVGNHGSETAASPPPGVERQVAGWHKRLIDSLAGIDGIVIEDKIYSLAVHYRACANRAAVLRLATRAAGALEDARLIGGKCVLNVVPVDAPNKGAALLAARARLRCRRIFYVGDDDTDEDVFALRKSDVLGIRVGVRRDSHADYALRDQSEIDELMAAILDELSD